jgi:hypothetical protein
VLDPNRKVLPCKDWARTGRCERGHECAFLHEGEGGEENIRNLTEEKLAEAFEEMRGTPIKGGIDGEESSDDDDDLEIVSAAGVCPSIHKCRGFCPNGGVAAANGESRMVSGFPNEHGVESELIFFA